MALSLPRGRLRAACEASTTTWLKDLKTLFDQAKERYPDVVWELLEGDREGEEVWGHKAIVYARAPTSFQNTYFSFGPAGNGSPSPYASRNGQSSYSLSINPPSPPRSPSPYFDGARVTSPAPSQSMGGLLRLSTSVNPALFSAQLEYLYTAQGMGAAFEFLFDTPELYDMSESEEARLDKLRKDLCYMWRAKLYSDVRIALTGDFQAPETVPGEDSAVAFSCHRFILVSRSPYFHGVLLSSFRTPSATTDGVLTLTLPSTAFTPASLHWALGFMYSGTLNFSHRTFDLDTAFAIVRSAAYLSLTTMSNEIEAHIVEEMMHGLFHAFLTFDEYEKITAGKWGVGGCRCRQCQRRAPRVLEFAILPEVSNKILDRGSRRALVGMFGEGWCSSEFANLPAKMRAGLLKGVVNRTTPQNIFPLLFASHNAQNKLANMNESWVDTVRDMVIQAQKRIDDVLTSQAEASFEQQEWLEIMDSDGQRFGDMDRVQLIMDSLKRGLKDANAGFVYQCLVSSILLRPHPTDTSATLLHNNSPIRHAVEATRLDVVKWIKKHWVNMRLAGGFDELEPWARKELSHELDVNVDELNSPPSTIRGPTTRTGLTVTLPKTPVEPEPEAASVTSLRAAVLNKNMAKSNTDTSSLASSFSTSPRAQNPSRIPIPPSISEPLVSSPQGSPTTPTTPIQLTGATFRSDTMDTQGSSTSLGVNITTTRTSPSPRPVAARRGVDNNTTEGIYGTPASRPKSIAASVTSVRSNATTTTLRRTGGAASTSNSTSSKATPMSPAANTRVLKTKTSPNAKKQDHDTTPRASMISTTSRPQSRVSEASTSFKTAPSELNIPPVPRQRTLSMASTSSNTSTAANVSTKLKPRSPSVVSNPRQLAPRKLSNASLASATSSVTSPRKVVKKTTTEPKTLTIKRPPSATSIRSTVSTTSKVGNKRATSLTSRTPTEKVPEVPKTTLRSTANKAPSVKSLKTTPSKASLSPTVPTTPTPAPVLVVPPSPSRPSAKGKGKATPSPSASPRLAPTATSSVLSSKSDGASTIRGTPKHERNKSSETITDITVTSGSTARRPPSPMKLDTSPSISVQSPPATMLPTPPGATPIDPNAGPPGLVLNVGIPCIVTSKRARFKAFARYLGDVQGEYGPWVGVEVPMKEVDRLEGRDWHDGTWGGVRYFDIRGSDWEETSGRPMRMRNLELAGGKRKREGDQLSVTDTRSNKRLRSASPAISDASMREARGLFVRPQQIVYVIEAR